MIDFTSIRNIIISGLSDYLDVLVIDSSSVNEKPDYPYFSFTVTTSFSEEFENPKENSFYDDENIYKEDGNITFSFKSLSNNTDESINNAIKAVKYFKLYGVDYLYENNISIKEVTNVENRNALMIEVYEVTNGFDVIFRVESNLIKDIINIEDVNVDINT